MRKERKSITAEGRLRIEAFWKRVDEMTLEGQVFCPEWLGPECLLVSEEFGSAYGYLARISEWEKYQKKIAKKR